MKITRSNFLAALLALLSTSAIKTPFAATTVTLPPPPNNEADAIIRTTFGGSAGVGEAPENSLFTVDIQAAGGPVNSPTPPIPPGRYAGWCFDADTPIDADPSLGNLYGGYLFSSQDPNLNGQLPNHNNVKVDATTWNKINWLINHRFDATLCNGAQPTMFEVQHAIVEIFGQTLPTANLPTFRQSVVDCLVQTATAETVNGFTLTCGDKVAVIFDIDVNWDLNAAPDVQLIFIEVPVACIGDRVWLDTNGNGIQDNGEVGKSDVTVQLYTCDDVLVGTTTTDSNGLYHFLVLPGDYYVKVLPPPGYTFTAQDAGANDEVDSDVDGTTGKMDCTTLVGGETDNSWDAGLVVGVDQCINFVKTADAATALNGAQMGYTYTVSNCGNTVFNNLAIIDDNGTPDFAGDDFTVASGISLNPGETKSYHVVVTLPVPTCSNTSGGPSAGTLITQVLPSGDIKVTFRQSRSLNDNVYGTPAAADGWGSHSFGNLTGSDKAEFRFTDGTGKVVLDFYLDYVSATNVSAMFPSGYASLGPNGGDGSMITGAKTNVLWWTSTLADNLNSNGPFPSLYLVNSPTPEASFPTWDYVDGYSVIVSKLAFGSAGFGGVTIPYVHNSPAKTGNNQVSPVPCGACIQNTARVVTVNGQTITGVLATDDAIVCTGDPVPPTPPCLLTHGALKLDKNTIQLPIKNNATKAIYLTELDLTFPAINGKLKKVTLNGDVWVGLTGSPVTLTSGFTTDPNKRKIDKGQTKTLVLQFEKNVSKTVGDYSGGIVKFGTDSSCAITFLP